MSAGLANDDEGVRLGDRQGPQHQLVQDAEDRRIRADRECERQGGGRRVPGRPPKRARSVAEIAPGCGNDVQGILQNVLPPKREPQAMLFRWTKHHRCKPLVACREVALDEQDKFGVLIRVHGLNLEVSVTRVVGEVAVHQDVVEVIY